MDTGEESAAVAAESSKRRPDAHLAARTPPASTTVYTQPKDFGSPRSRTNGPNDVLWEWVASDKRAGGGNDDVA